MIKFIFFFLLLFSFTVYSQNSYDIKGVVKNKENIPLESLAIKLLPKNTDNVKYYTITDKNGNFTITDVINGDYDIEIVSLSYKDYKKSLRVISNINLNEIILENDINKLDEIVITAKKKILKQTDEGILLNVEGTNLSNMNSISDILNFSPNVSTANGIEIVGSKDIGIIFNDIKLKLKPSQIPAFLQSIKPKTVKNIEILDRLDSSNETNISGIIKITTTDDVGTMGSISSTLIYNDFFGLTNDFSIYYNHSKIRLYANIYKSDKKMLFTSSENQIINNEFFYNINDKRDFKRQERVAVIGLDYKIDSLNVLSVLYDYTEDNDKDFNISTNTQINSTEVIDSLIISDKKLDHLEKTHTISLQYNKILDSLNSYFRISSDYVYDDYKIPYSQNQQFFSINTFVEETLTNQLYSTLNNLFGTQIDWNKNYSNGNNLKLGAKYSFSNIDEDYFFVNNTSNEVLTNIFNYDENLLVAYFNYKHKFKKTTLTLGLRNEYNFNKFGNNNMFDKKTDNFNILPTLYLVHNINKTNRTYFYFTKKINRPKYFQFNPSIQISNSSFQSSGNESLKSVEAYRFQVGYTYNKKYSAILRYDYKENIIISNSVFNNETGITFSQPVNSGYFNYALMYISIPVKFTEWWESNNKFNIKYTNYISPLFSNEAFESFYSTLNSNHTFYLPHKIRINLGFNYVAKNKYLNVNFENVFTSNFSLSAPIIKDKLRFHLSINDLLKTQRNNYSKIINNIYSYTNSEYNSRSAFVSLTYDFSSGKDLDDTLIKPIIEDEKNRSTH